MCICIILISALCLWDLPMVHSIGIFPDELGYWSSAATFSGYDWSGAMTQTPYYSFFYGILLIPIFNIFIDNPIYMFRAAVILNTIILDACFICAYIFFHKIDSDDNSPKKHILIAFYVTAYPAYLLFSRITISENLLLLITWLVAIEFVRYIEKRHIFDFLLMGILSISGYFTHQRFLVVIIALVLTLIFLYITCKNLNKKKIFGIIAVLFILIILYVVMVFIKNSFKNIAYSQTADYIRENNDYGSVISSISRMFNVQNIKNLLISFVGKLLYIGMATWGIAYVAIIQSVKYIYDCIKNRKKSNKLFLNIFLFLSFIGSILLAVIVMCNIPDNGERFDTVIYGRYSEYLYGLMLMFGLNSLYKNYKLFLKQEIIALIIQFVLLIVLVPYFNENPNYTVQWLSCSALNEFFYGKNFHMVDSFFIVLLRNSILILLLILGSFIKEAQLLGSYKSFLLWLGVSVAIYSSIYTVNNVYFDWKEDVYTQNQIIENIIKNEDAYKEVYCLYEDVYIVALQFDMPKTFMHHVESVEHIPKNYLVVTSIAYNGNEKLLLLEKTNYLSLWKVIE